MDLVRAGDVPAAWEFVQSLTPDLRTAVKPFFTNFTSGRTTEAATAHAVADLVESFVDGVWRTFPAQVWTRGTWGDLQSAIAVPVVVGQTGWIPTTGFTPADDEAEALQAADRALAAAQDEQLARLG